jgi:hypothetical protein
MKVYRQSLTGDKIIEYEYIEKLDFIKIYDLDFNEISIDKIDGIFDTFYSRQLIEKGEWESFFETKEECKDYILLEKL